jgi:hypothetical protein
MHAHPHALPPHGRACAAKQSVGGQAVAQPKHIGLTESDRLQFVRSSIRFALNGAQRHSRGPLIDGLTVLTVHHSLRDSGVYSLVG